MLVLLRHPGCCSIILYSHDEERYKAERGEHPPRAVRPVSQLGAEKTTEPVDWHGGSPFPGMEAAFDGAASMDPLVEEWTADGGIDAQQRADEISRLTARPAPPLPLCLGCQTGQGKGESCSEGSAWQRVPTRWCTWAGAPYGICSRNP